MRRPRTDCCCCTSTYCSKATGAGPLYWLRRSTSSAFSMPFTVSAYLYCASPAPALPTTSTYCSRFRKSRSSSTTGNGSIMWLLICRAAGRPAK